MNKSRVAIFRQEFLSQSETFVRDHIIGLNQFEPVVVTRKIRPHSLEVPDVRIELAGNPRQMAVKASAAHRRLSPLTHARLETRLYRKALSRVSPSLVHAHFGTDGAEVLPAARSLRLPLIVTFHGYDATVDLDDLRAAGGSAATMVRSMPRLWAEVSGVVAVSQHIKDCIVARGADPAKIRIIPCGVDTEVFRALQPSHDEQVSFLFVGRLVQKKGCVDLLQALAGMSSPPRTTIIGDGPLRGQLEEFARRNRLPVLFLGAAKSSDVRSRLQSADAVVMPSKRADNGDSEGLPVVSLEAGASERPVVGYAHSGLRDVVVHGETGLLAREGDVPALRQHLEIIRKDRHYARQLGVQARLRVKKCFEQSSKIEELESFYQDVSVDVGVGTHHSSDASRQENRL